MLIDWIRKYKWSFALYNFFKRSELAHNIPLYKKYGVDKAYWQSVSSRDFKGIPHELNTFDQVDSKLHLPESERFQALPSQRKSELLNWSENGFVILRDYFDPILIEKINKEVKRLDEEGMAKWKYNRIMFALHQSDLIKSVATDPDLINILELLLDKEIEIFQSLNFLKGSEQKSHSDSIHMTTFPFGNLIAAWIALEDITEENGPLHYYPGSHKLPYIMNQDFGNEGNRWKLGDKDYKDYEQKVSEVIDENGLNKKIFLANKGDVLIWHANLLHGGEPMKDKSKTRKSMVLHYYAKDAICYHEITERPTLKKHIKKSMSV